MTCRPERRAFVVGVRPEKREQYLAPHRTVWPSVERKLTECNVRDYSIFICGDTLSPTTSTSGRTTRRICDGSPTTRLRKNGGRTPTRVR
ncbi:hypothetical protein SANTM175S_05704 [Streptomyces antimycoticus]